jgi:hypothetical protein
MEREMSEHIRTRRLSIRTATTVGSGPSEPAPRVVAASTVDPTDVDLRRENTGGAQARDRSCSPPTEHLRSMPPIEAEGAGGTVVGASISRRSPAVGSSSPTSRRSSSTSTPSPSSDPKILDPRLRPFAHALADLLLADLLKYPPKP